MDPDSKPAPLSAEWMIQAYERGISRRQERIDRGDLTEGTRRRLEVEIRSLQGAIRGEERKIADRQKSTE